MKKAWLVSPLFFLGFLGVLIFTWLTLEPAKLIELFDNNGRSPLELITLPFFLACVPLVWWKKPFAGSKKRQYTFCFLVSLVAIMAVVKELDLHQSILHFCYPQFVSDDGGLIAGNFFKPNGKPLTGTPFKMRVLTNGAVPFGMKSLIVLYFVSFFGAFAAGFIALFAKWIKGVFSLAPAAWAWGCCGASGVLVQISDRLPAWLDHQYGLDKAADGAISRASSLCTCLEEGGELMLAIFALLTIWYGWKQLRMQKEINNER